MTSELWTGLYQGSADNIRKWLYGSVLIRDWAADGSTALDTFTPFDPTTGDLITTLLSPAFAGGQFHELGAITEAGVEFTPKFTTDETKIWQSRRSQRTDVTQDDEEVMFTMAEATGVADLLRNNLPLTNIQEVGAVGYSVTKPNFTDIVYRQIVVIGVDGHMDDADYICEIRPRVSLVKVGKRGFAAKSIDGTELTFSVYPDPHSGFPARTLRGGPFWAQLGGPVLFPTPQVAPVGVAGGAAGKATITLAAPVSKNDPFTYAVLKSTDGFTTSTSATLDTTFNLVGYNTVAGTVTVKVTGVTAGATTFRVVVTGSNATTATSTSSNSVTVT